MTFEELLIIYLSVKILVIKNLSFNINKNMYKTNTILLVDDSRLIRKATKKILDSMSYINIIMAENGKKAIKLAKKKNIDLILMDLMMPVMDGFTALEILKQDAETKNIPVIIQSTMSENAEMETALKLGAENYLIKPFKEKYLPEIKKILRNKEESKTEIE